MSWQTLTYHGGMYHDMDDFYHATCIMSSETCIMFRMTFTMSTYTLRMSCVVFPIFMETFNMSWDTYIMSCETLNIIIYMYTCTWGILPCPIIHVWIANRIKAFLPKIISRDQNGFIKGRFIGENTRVIYDIIEYAEQNDIPWLLLTIDFEKAFDSLEWSFMEQVLTFFDFGSSITNWITLFYTGI
jgi:hypothetical protein